MIRHGINVEHGVEGPREDPWSFIRVTARIDGPDKTKIADVKIGLGCDAKFTTVSGNGDAWYEATRDEDRAKSIFRELVGCTFDQAVKLRYRYDNRSKCHCGSRKVHLVKGLPGEELLLCSKCGEVVASSFDIAEVM